MTRAGSYTYRPTEPPRTLAVAVYHRPTRPAPDALRRSVVYAELNRTDQLERLDRWADTWRRVGHVVRFEEGATVTARTDAGRLEAVAVPLEADAAIPSAAAVLERWGWRPALEPPHVLDDRPVPPLAPDVPGDLRELMGTAWLENLTERSTTP